MLASRKVVFSSFVLLGIVLGGCKLLKKGDADGGLDGSVEDAAPAAVDTAAAVDADAGAAPTTTATTPTTVTRIVKADGGLSDAGAVAALDAGAAVAAADAGAPQECCCEATGFPLQSVAMSECNKTRKGQCVKKERCEAAPAPTTPTPTTPAEPGTCCCDVGGTKAIASQKECTTTKKGQCVPLANCGLKFKRPGQK